MEFVLRKGGLHGILPRLTWEPYCPGLPARASNTRSHVTIKPNRRLVQRWQEAERKRIEGVADFQKIVSQARTSPCRCTALGW